MSSRSRNDLQDSARQQLLERRRQLEEALEDVQGSLEGEVGWAPRGRNGLLLLLTACAGFALATWGPSLRGALGGRRNDRSSSA